ncbi:hypothetical protein C8R43DRAFT_1202788 [Mycena crocata]|nr:hypothetical protein C8R43DRAFT_1202788 [Mycena crocata]
MPRAKKNVTGKVLFQRQMGLVGRDAELIRVMIFAFFDVKKPVRKEPIQKQKVEAWDLFRGELRRLFARFRHDDGGEECMKSALQFARHSITEYRCGKMSLRESRVKIKNRKDLDNAIRAAEKRVKENTVKVESSAESTVIPPEELSTTIEVLDAELPQQSQDTPGEAEVRKFLEGCQPSLAFLLSDLIGAGIDRREWINAMRAWPRRSLHGFLLRNFNKNEYGRPDEGGVVVPALLAQFEGENSEAEAL